MLAIANGVLSKVILIAGELVLMLNNDGEVLMLCEEDGLLVLNIDVEVLMLNAAEGAVWVLITTVNDEVFM